MAARSPVAREGHERRCVAAGCPIEQPVAWRSHPDRSGTPRRAMILRSLPKSPPNMADTQTAGRLAGNVAHCVGDEAFARDRLGALLDEAWPGTSERLARAYQLGVCWHRCFHSWAIFDAQGDCRAHAGAVVLPLGAMGGEYVEILALQAVACRRSDQGQGLATACVEAALAWWQDQGGSVPSMPSDSPAPRPALLHALAPRFYRRIGFREHTERRYVLKIAAKEQVEGDWRAMTLEDVGGRAVLEDLGRRRAPKTHPYACMAPMELLMLDAILSGREASLCWSPRLDAAIIGDFSETHADLRDIVATQSTSIPDLLASLPRRPREVTVHCPLAAEYLGQGGDAGSASPMHIDDVRRERAFERGSLMRAGHWPAALDDLCLPPTMGV